MSSGTRMVHRCAIQRDASSGLDTNEWNDEPTPSWGAHLSDVSCYFWLDRVRDVQDGDKVANVTARKLIVRLSVDVTEKDRVMSVTDRRGRELADGPMRIVSVGQRKDHQVLTLEDYS